MTFQNPQAAIAITPAADCMWEVRVGGALIGAYHTKLQALRVALLHETREQPTSPGMDVQLSVAQQVADLFCTLLTENVSSLPEVAYLTAVVDGLGTAIGSALTGLCVHGEQQAINALHAALRGVCKPMALWDADASQARVRLRAITQGLAELSGVYTSPTTSTKALDS